MSEQQTAPLNQYLQPLFERKRLVLVVWGLVIALGVGAGLAAPVSYASTASILVYPSSGDPTKALETDDADVDMATELRIATSQAVVTMVIERLTEQGVGADRQVLADNITAASTKESTILDLTFVAASPELATAGANAFAESYLDFRAKLAAGNKLSAEAAIDDRIALLQQQLAAVQTRIEAAGVGGRVILNSEKDTIEADLEAQQLALASLSTPTIDATVIIDEAELPRAPEGLGLVQILVGAMAGGLVSGVVAAYVVAAFVEGKVTPATSSSDDRPDPIVSASPSDASPSDPSPSDASPSDPSPSDALPSDASPSDALPSDASPSEVVTAEEASVVVAQPAITVTPAPRPEPLHDRRLGAGSVPSGDERPAGRDDEEAGGPDPAMVVGDDMEPVIRYLQGLGATGSVAAMVVGERHHQSAATVALGLAEALQTLGARVLIIDAGIDTPTLDGRLRLPTDPGLGQVLVGARTLTDSVCAVGGSEGLDILTVGSAITSAVLAPSFERLLNEARLCYHTILVVGGSLQDDGIIPQVAPLTEGVIIGTDRPSGDLADQNLHHIVAELPTPTLDLLSAASVDGLAALTGSAAPGV